MQALRRILTKFVNLFRRRRGERDFDAELDAHLEIMQEELQGRGMTVEEARREARVKLGGVEQARELHRQARGFHWLETLAQDVRFALRTLRKNPGFTAVAVLTLALGIGGTTAIFTLVQQVMLRSLPVAQPQQLWRVGDAVQCCFSNGYTQGDGSWLPLNDWSLFSWEAYKLFRADTPAFEDLAAFEIGEHNAGLAVRRAGSQAAVEARIGEYVSGNFFETFGVSAWRGHLFTDADDREGVPPVAVMSYHTWEGEYGSDPSVIGATYDFNGHMFTIIGVGPPGFLGAKIDADGGTPDFWLPLTTEPLIAGPTTQLKNPRLAWLDLIGRVRPGVNPKTLEAQMQVELHQWLASHVPDMTLQEKKFWEKQTLRLVPGGAGVSLMRQTYENGLRLLMFAALCVLLVACANIANLLLARGLRNRHQTAVRVALGASRARLVRKALAESVTLSVFGAVAGIGVAYAGAKLILRLAFGSPGNWIPVNATPSTAVLLFALGVALITGIVFGMAPAWMTSHAEPVEALRGANRITGRSRGIFGAAGAQKTLVIVQAALSLVLLTGAALLGESLRNMEHSNYGFDTSGRYLASIDPKISDYKQEHLAPLFNEIEEHLRAIPGVRAVGAVLEAPQVGWVPGHDIRIDGRPEADGSSGWTRVTPGFFDTFSDKILMGRAITDDDNAATQPVAVVNQAFAKKFFNRENPVGQHFGPLPEKNEGMYEIVGVARDIDFAGGVQPMYFLPEAQATQFDEPESESREVWSHYLYNVVIWAPVNPPNLEAQVKGALADAAPDLVTGGSKPYSEVIRGHFSQENMIASLTWLFGGVGLVLAAVGLYGVTSYGVEQRTSEIGVRMALGANRGSILRMVIGEGMSLALIGIAVGIACAQVLGRFLRSELFGIAMTDPVTFAAVAFGFALVALVACYVPARRAMRVDPVSAMRSE
ncbi:MAG TPA: ABC transporter permease [Candidatus Acidoferrales bacterium]